MSEDTCDHCGEVRPGRQRLMFYRVLRLPPGPPVVREFICHRCRRRMLAYAIIGFSLLAIVLIVLGVAMVRLGVFSFP